MHTVLPVLIGVSRLPSLPCMPRLFLFMPKYYLMHFRFCKISTLANCRSIKEIKMRPVTAIQRLISIKSMEQYQHTDRS